MPAEKDYFGITDPVRRLTPPDGLEGVHKDGYSWAIQGDRRENTTWIAPDQWNVLIAQMRGVIQLLGDVSLPDDPRSPFMLRDAIMSYVTRRIVNLMPGAIDDAKDGFVTALAADISFMSNIAAFVDSYGPYIDVIALGQSPTIGAAPNTDVNNHEFDAEWAHERVLFHNKTTGQLEPPVRGTGTTAPHAAFNPSGAMSPVLAFANELARRNPAATVRVLMVAHGGTPIETLTGFNGDRTIEGATEDVDNRWMFARLIAAQGDMPAGWKTKFVFYAGNEANGGTFRPLSEYAANPKMPARTNEEWRNEFKFLIEELERINLADKDTVFLPMQVYCGEDQYGYRTSINSRGAVRHTYSLELLGDPRIRTVPTIGLYAIPEVDENGTQPGAEAAVHLDDPSNVIAGRRAAAIAMQKNPQIKSINIGDWERKDPFGVSVAVRQINKFVSTAPSGTHASPYTLKMEDIGQTIRIASGSVVILPDWMSDPYSSLYRSSAGLEFWFRVYDDGPVTFKLPDSHHADLTLRGYGSVLGTAVAVQQIRYRPRALPNERGILIRAVYDGGKWELSVPGASDRNDFAIVKTVGASETYNLDPLTFGGLTQITPGGIVRVPALLLPAYDDRHKGLTGGLHWKFQMTAAGSATFNLEDGSGSGETTSTIILSGALGNASGASHTITVAAADLRLPFMLRQGPAGASGVNWFMHRVAA